MLNQEIDVVRTADSSSTPLRDRPLIIFELANNHQGSLTHAHKIIDGLAQCKSPYEALFDFAVKFQFRDLQTFIDPGADSVANKHIARFRSTQLKERDWVEITETARTRGFLVVTTPFDEISVELALRLSLIHI